MRKITLAAAALVGMSVSVQAYAEVTPDTMQTVEKTTGARTGIEIGVQTGYAAPMGKVQNVANNNLSGIIKGNIPAQVEFGYRILPALTAGAYFQYGFGFMGKDADPCSSSGLSCSARDIRLGLQARYHFRPTLNFDPWLGVGTGYEWLTVSFSPSGNSMFDSSSSTYKGFEFFDAQAGLDFSLFEGFTLGPAATFGVGQFSSCSGGPVAHGPSQIVFAGCSISDKATHYWGQLGLRASFVL
jgi:opacity protein-like surface antigen